MNIVLAHIRFYHFPAAGDHFGMVGQLMFKKGSDVEVALSRFTSREAAELARKERIETTPPDPRPRL